MSLEAGRKLGPYEIVSRIGVGGMGEVYQATDTKLKRQVAIKVLPESIAADADRLARFQREAEVLASLNHPHIAAIYGLEETESVTALVMELVEGEDLAERLKGGAIPTDESITIAKQIAEALEAAHQQGIVHRDLKPANVKLREDGTVKVLDFGLAKALDQDSAQATQDSQLSHSPTISRHATEAGMILGTAAYMSPEQARGKPVDKRADVWSFGVVLYEMLTGRRAFEGEDMSMTLAAVLRAEIDLNMLPVDTPPRLRQVVKACLQRDPTERLHDIADARLLMDGAFDTVAAEEPFSGRGGSSRRRVGAVAALAAGAAAVASGVIVSSLRPAAEPTHVQRLSIVLPADQRLGDIDRGTSFDISPDDSLVVYVANDQLFLRSSDSQETTSVEGTDGARAPFFSPDGRWVGFFQQHRLRKVAVDDREILTVASADGFVGGIWGLDGSIILHSRSGGLARIDAAGGEPSMITELDSERGEITHRSPDFLPGGEAPVFEIDHRGSTGEVSEVAVLALNTGEIEVLFVGGGSPRYLPTGHIVYVVNEDFGTGVAGLRAVPFDLDTRRVTAQPRPLGVDVILTEPYGISPFTVSESGTLMKLPVDASVTPLRSLVWVDRSGHREVVPAPADLYREPRLSPDGSRVAVTVRRQGSDIWIWDLERRIRTRLTQQPGLQGNPLWSPDGQRVVFQHSPTGLLMWQAANGTDEERPVVADAEGTASGFTADGSELLFTQTPSRSVSSGADIRLAALSGGVETLVSGERRQAFASLAPNDRWIAYESDESGISEIYVRPFPDTERDRVQVSSGGGMRPLWNPNGRELHFLSLEGRLMTVPVEIGPEFETRIAQPVWREEVDMRWDREWNERNYDVDRDGERFLIATRGDGEEQQAPARFDLVLNWYQEITERLSVP